VKLCEHGRRLWSVFLSGEEVIKDMMGVKANRAKESLMTLP